MGLTQVELGDRVGIVYQAIAKYERGATEPTWPVVLRLAAALGVSTDAFKATPGGAAGEPPPPRPAGKRK